MHIAINKKIKNLFVMDAWIRKKLDSSYVNSRTRKIRARIDLLTFNRVSSEWVRGRNDFQFVKFIMKHHPSTIISPCHLSKYCSIKTIRWMLRHGKTTMPPGQLLLGACGREDDDPRILRWLMKSLSASLCEDCWLEASRVGNARTMQWIARRVSVAEFDIQNGFFLWHEKTKYIKWALRHNYCNEVQYVGSGNIFGMMLYGGRLKSIKWVIKHFPEVFDDADEIELDCLGNCYDSGLDVARWVLRKKIKYRCIERLSRNIYVNDPYQVWLFNMCARGGIA